MEHKMGCVVCGKELTYLKTTEKLECYFCDNLCDVDVKCVDGHYVCDRCHSQSANQIIEDFCIKTQLSYPFEIADILMKHPSIKMHGPEHHFLVPAVLLSAYYNKINKKGQKERKIKAARKRAEKVPGGFCGSHGNCGAGVGTGIFISLLTNTTSLSEKEWALTNLMTARSLAAIAQQGGPRCCKRDTFIAFVEANEFLNKEFDFTFKIPTDIRCKFHQFNNECRKEKCPFYKIHNGR